VAKASWRKNKNGDDIELRRFWARASPFKAAAGLQRSFNHPGIWCRQHGAQQGQPRGLSIASTVAEKGGGVASWRRMVVTLMMMRCNNLKN
jgi:hypothetical protein